MTGRRTWGEPEFLTATLGAFVAGAVAWTLARQAVDDGLPGGRGTLVAVVPSLAWSALRRGNAGVDLLAVVALNGTLAVHEYVAGSLIAVMVATGALESAAQRRASRDLRALLEHAPRSARRRAGDPVEVVPLGDVVAGDLLVLGPGEVVPIDLWLALTDAVLDQSVLTASRCSSSARRASPCAAASRTPVGASSCASATAEDSTYAPCPWAPCARCSSPPRGRPATPWSQTSTHHLPRSRAEPADHLAVPMQNEARLPLSDVSVKDKRRWPRIVAQSLLTGTGPGAYNPMQVVGFVRSSAEAP